ncbi:MAG TPA: GNAT family N-acetyltransferase [Asanoa sp.]|jgi:GNAT superfamily N-acetyltransferase
MTVTLRQAGPDEDLAPVGALHHRSRVAAYRDFVPVEELETFGAAAFGAWWTERWTWERRTHRLTVAECDGRLVGFTYVGPDGDDDGVAQLYAIHLEPQEQGKGLGRLLMVDALDALRAAGWPRVVLWVLAGNAHARRFYERGGWAPDGREREDVIGTVTTPQLRYARDIT